MFATFSKIHQTNTFLIATNNPCHKMANRHWQIWILETPDIHFSSAFSTQNFKGFCGKTIIKIKRKVGIKIKNSLGGICPLSVPSKYLFLCSKRDLGFNKKFCRKITYCLSVLFQKSFPQNGKWTLTKNGYWRPRTPTSPALSLPKISKASAEKEPSQ